MGVLQPGQFGPHVPQPLAVWETGRHGTDAWDDESHADDAHAYPWSGTHRVVAHPPKKRT